MKFDEDEENNFAQSGPKFFGAIFMSNRSTKKECLKRKLFGLPPAQANFVKKIKAQMPLFLFEYEERKLYGVFQATSDGAMNIVPGAFRMSGRQVPAQILFKTLWHCHPLSEHEFRDTIKDNYYTANKFNLGLSKDQVFKLLCLFNSRKVKIQKPPRLSSGGIKKQSGNSDLRRVRVSEEGKFVTTDRDENQLSIDYEPMNLTNYSRSSLNLSGDTEKLILETDHPITEGQHRFPYTVLNAVEPQIPNSLRPTSRIDIGNEHVNTHCNPYPPKSPSFWYNHPYSVGMDHNTSSQELVAHSKNSVDGFFPLSRSQVNPSRVDSENLNMPTVRRYEWDANTTNLGDYIPLTSEDHFEPSSTRNLFPEALYPRNKNIDSTDLECYRGLSFPDPSVLTMPSRDANFKSRFPCFACSPGKGMSHVLDHPFSLVPKHELCCEGPLYSNYEPSAASLSLSSEGFGVHPLVSQNIDTYEGLVHDDPTTFDDYRTHMNLHSDNQDKRTSVFSRLTVAQEANVQDNDEYLGNKHNMNMSVNQLMNMFYQSQNIWGKTLKKSQKRFSGRPDDGDCFKNIAKTDMGTAPEKDEEMYSNEKPKEIPIVNFKRRSKTQKIGGGTEMGGAVEGALHKRRKLVRPSFGNWESSSDKVIISERNSNVLGSSQGINEDKENLGSERVFVRSDGDDGNGNRPSYNMGVQNGVGFEAINGKTEKNANNEKLPSQELLGIKDCSLNMQCCEGDNDKAEEGLGKAPMEFVDISDKEFVGNPEGLYLEFRTIQAGSSDDKAERSLNIEDSAAQGHSQELVSIKDCFLKMQCSSLNEPASCIGNTEGLSLESHITQPDLFNEKKEINANRSDSNVEGLSHNVQCSSQDLSPSCEPDNGIAEECCTKARHRLAF